MCYIIKIKIQSKYIVQKEPLKKLWSKKNNTWTKFKVITYLSLKEYNKKTYRFMN
jgi:hypothetical protein